MKIRFPKLYLQVFIGIILGILVGFFFPHFAPKLKPLGDIFIRLIRMLLAPVIFATVTVGIARMGDIKAVGRIGVKALVYFEFVSGFALVIGLVVVNIVRPGAGMNINPATIDPSTVAMYTAAAQHRTALDFILNIIPSSAVGSLVEGNILQIILVSVLFGIALSRLGSKKKDLVIAVLDGVLQALFGMVRIVMYVAPLAAFGSMAFIIGEYGLGTLRQFGSLMACVYLTSLVFIVFVLGSIAWLCRFSLWRFVRYIKDEVLIAFGTCSTEAVMPQMMEKLERLGCEQSLVGMVLPAGYSFNADGSSIYLTMAAIFIAQATNTHLTLRDQLVVLAVLLLTSKGSAGVAGSGFVTLAATLASMDKIPVAGVVLLLGADSFLNQARAVTNLIGNGVATIAIARWEGTFDAAKADAELAGAAAPIGVQEPVEE
jgi:DAACS family dicarboxylate/amino acid:cation (Na+ or H+) symporter/aerobic C4-dicarboxylate transport protein